MELLSKVFIALLGDAIGSKGFMEFRGAVFLPPLRLGREGPLMNPSSDFAPEMLSLLLRLFRLSRPAPDKWPKRLVLFDPKGPSTLLFDPSEAMNCVNMFLYFF